MDKVKRQSEKTLNQPTLPAEKPREKASSKRDFRGPSTQMVDDEGNPIVYPHPTFSLGKHKIP